MLSIYCDFCDELVDTRSPDSYRRIVGWIPNRGGAVPVLAEPIGGWAHFICINEQKQGAVNRLQEGLF